MRRGQKVVLLSSNSLWNITNFRSPIVERLAADGYRILVLAPRNADLDKFTLPAHVHAVEIDRSGLNPFKDAALLWRYAMLLHRLRPVAYFGWTIKPNIYGSLAGRLFNVPTILNVSGLGTAFLRSSVLSLLVCWMYRAAFKRAHVVFFQNSDDRDMFVKRKLVDPNRARLVAGSGIDLEKFRPEPVASGPQSPVFLLIARLLRDKGIEEFVEAARTLKRELPQARFQLLGPLDRDNRSAIQKDELDRWITSGTIEYLGAAHDVRPFIRASSAVVLPSYREGLPRSLLEGAAMGRPLIATDVPGCRDVVAHGQNGYLCKARDSVSLAEAMKALAQLGERDLIEMGRASRKLVECRFSDRLVTEAYVGALRELVSA